MHWFRRYYWYQHLKNSPYRDWFRPVWPLASLFRSNTQPQSPRTYVALDCETTHLDPKKAELVSIGAVKIVNHKILTSTSFSVMLQTPITLDAQSIRIHQLRHQDLNESGVSVKEALHDLLTFIGQSPIVGYHIRYDQTILDRACREHLGFPFPNPVIEVSELYCHSLEKQIPNAYHHLGLQQICHHLDLPQPTDQHDALQDALTAALIYVRLTQGALPTPQRASSSSIPPR